jgi:hypothetical protein
MMFLRRSGPNDAPRDVRRRLTEMGRIKWQGELVATLKGVISTGGIHEPPATELLLFPNLAYNYVRARLWSRSPQYFVYNYLLCIFPTFQGNSNCLGNKPLI